MSNNLESGGGGRITKQVVGFLCVVAVVICQFFFFCEKKTIHRSVSTILLLVVSVHFLEVVANMSSESKIFKLKKTTIMAILLVSRPLR